MDKNTEYEIIETHEGRVKLAPVEMGIAKLKIVLNGVLCSDPDTRFCAFYTSTTEKVCDIHEIAIESTGSSREGLPDSEYFFDVLVPISGTTIFINALGLNVAKWTCVTNIELKPNTPATAYLVAGFETAFHFPPQKRKSLLTQMKERWRMFISSI